jgi:hypothetical protein
MASKYIAMRFSPVASFSSPVYVYQQAHSVQRTARRFGDAKEKKILEKWPLPYVLTYYFYINKFELVLSSLNC